MSRNKRLRKRKTREEEAKERSGVRNQSALAKRKSEKRTIGGKLISGYTLKVRSAVDFSGGSGCSSVCHL
jgi:hypothetical protein